MSAPVVLGITIRADGSAQVSGEINRVQAAVTGAGTAAQNTNREFANMATQMSSLGSIAKAFGVTLGLVGLAGLAKDILDTNRSMESLRAQLLALTGSAAQAQQAFDFITKFAVNTPFEIQGLTKSFITLQNYGLTPTTEVMQAITDQAAKLGGRTETLQGITLALGQAWGKGKLQGQEILQMVDQGVPVWDLLAKVTGKNVAELQNMSEKGLITSDVIDKLIGKMGEMAAGSNAAAMDTLNGKISNLADAWHQFEDALLQSKAEGIIKDIVSSISDTLNILTNQLGGTIDNQIAHAKARIDNFNSMGAVGGFVADLSGYDINVEKNKLDSLNRIKQTQDEDAATKAQALEAKKAIDMQVTATDASTKAKKEHKAAISDEERASIALSKSFNDAIASLNLHNIELSKTPRELEEATLKSKGYTDAMVKQAMALYDIGTALEAKKKLNETEKTELQSLTDQYNKLTMSAHDYYATTLSAKGIPAADQGPLVAQFDKNAGLEAANKKNTETTATLDAYNKSLDSAHAKTSDLGAITSAVFSGALGGINLMAGAFDTMVNSISANTKALEENATMQKLNETTVDPAIKAANVSKYAKEEAKLNNDNIKAQLTGASQLAGAAASMFDKKSAAAKAFHAVEVTLSVARMAMDAVEIARSISKTATKLAEGAASMFASMGPLGFAGVAAMVAVMAGLGFAASGGGGSSAPAVVESASTGTVLGDAAAQSDSINKTNQLLKDIQAQNYPVLKSIDDGISGLANGISNVITRLYQGGGLSASTANLTPSATTLQTVITGVIGASGALSALVLGPLGLLTPLLHFVPILGPILDGITNFFVNGIFGGNQSRKVTGQGIGTDATSLGSVRAGNNVNSYQYANIETKTDGGWFGSDKYSTSQQRSGIDSATQKAFNDIFKSMGDTMFGLADALGGDLTKRVNNYVIPAMNVELKGLSGEDAAKKMNGVINTMLDNMAGAVFGDVLGQYQKLGEGMLETAVRIATEIIVVKDSMALSGLSIATNAIAISDALVQAAGSIKDFQAQFTAYFDKFYSSNEKQVQGYKDLNSQLLAVDTMLPSTREGYRKLIEATNTSNAADIERYALLIKLSGAADAYYSSLEAQTTTLYKTIADSYVATASKMTGFIDSFKKFSVELSLGALSTSSAASKSSAIRNAFNNDVSAIKKGYGTTPADNLAFTNAMSSLQANSSSFLTNSISNSTSAEAYGKDYNSVQAAIALGISQSSKIKTDAQLQLDALNAQVTGLIDVKNAINTVNGSTLSVAGAISALAKNEAERVAIEKAAADAIAKAKADQAAADAEAARQAPLKAIYNSWAGMAVGENHGGTQHQPDYAANISAATGMSSFDPKLSLAQYQALSKGVSQAVSNLNWVFSDQNKGTRWRNAEGDAYLSQLEAYAVSIKAGNLDAHVPGTAHIPGFAKGGDHAGGLRLVGENGPELEATGPSRIFNNSQTKAMLDNSELIAEIKALKDEVRLLRQDARAQNLAIAENTKNTIKQMQRWDIDGIPIKTNDPIDVKVAA